MTPDVATAAASEQRAVEPMPSQMRQDIESLSGAFAYAAFTCVVLFLAIRGGWQPTERNVGLAALTFAGLAVATWAVTSLVKVVARRVRGRR